MVFCSIIFEVTLCGIFDRNGGEKALEFNSKQSCEGVLASTMVSVPVCGRIKPDHKCCIMKASSTDWVMSLGPFLLIYG